MPPTRLSSGSRFAPAPVPRLVRAIGFAATVATFPIAAILTNARPHTSRVVEVSRMTSLKLPDGTRVVLWPKSRLQYRDDFASRRRLSLFGEATFAIPTGPALSLWTETGMLTTSGASIWVRANRRDTTSVLVHSGSIRLRALNEDMDPAYRSATVAAGQTGYAVRMVGAFLR